MEQFLIDLLVKYTGLESGTAALLVSVGLWTSVAAATAFLMLFFYVTRSFHDHVTYTGNRIFPILDAGKSRWKLELRTFGMYPIDDLLPTNLAFRVSLLFALMRTPKHDPFVRMSEADMDVLQPNLIGGFSMLFSEGVADWQAERKIATDSFLMAVSYEKYDDAKSRKLRIIIATPQVLEAVLVPEIAQNMTFERAHQHNRLLTLMKMAEHWKRECDLPIDARRIVRPVEVYKTT